MRPQPRYSKEEHARRGTTLYEQQVRSQVEADNFGNVVALDVDSGAFEVAEDSFIAFNRKADSLEQAIRSATADVRAAGFEVARVEMPALV